MTTIAFVHVGNDGLLPRILVASVRRAMPAARILHLADETTPAVTGVDAVVRHPYDGVHLMTFRLAHFAALEPCNVAFLDTDVIVQRDLADVFSRPFDIALTRREQIGLDPRGVDVAQAMPYNTGVMFGRPGGHEFWVNAARCCEAFPAEIQRWWGDQYAVKMVAEGAPISILELPCAEYNHSPESAHEHVSGCAVVHYKGKRKDWMVERGRTEFGIVA